MLNLYLPDQKNKYTCTAVVAGLTNKYERAEFYYRGSHGLDVQVRFFQSCIIILILANSCENSLTTARFELRKNIPVVMQLKNSTGDRIAFKVKTTSPKKYCVRPSSGIIEPHGLKEVQVIMQAQREPPASYSDCRDKFLVQCVKVGGTVKDVTSELFDPAKGSAIRQTKLRVILVPPALPPSPVPEGNESEPASPGSVRAHRCESYHICCVTIPLLLLQLILYATIV